MRVLIQDPLQYSSDSTCSRQTFQLAVCLWESRLGLLRTVTHTHCSFITAQIGRGPDRFQNVRSVLLKQGSKHTRTAIEDNLVKHRQAQSMAPLSKRPWNTSCFSLQPRHPRAAAQATFRPPGFSRIRESRAQNAPQQCWRRCWWAQAHERPLTVPRPLPACLHHTRVTGTSLRWKHFPLQNSFLL